MKVFVCAILLLLPVAFLAAIVATIFIMKKFAAPTGATTPAKTSDVSPDKTKTPKLEAKKWVKFIKWGIALIIIGYIGIRMFMSETSTLRVQVNDTEWSNFVDVPAGWDFVVIDEKGPGHVALRFWDGRIESDFKYRESGTKVATPNWLGQPRNCSFQIQRDEGKGVAVVSFTTNLWRRFKARLL